MTSNFLFLPSNGVALQVRRGSLCIRDADGAETLYPARVHGFKTIIMGGRGGSITDEAIRWTAREGVAIFLMCRAGEAFAIIGEAVGMDNRRQALAMRQRQYHTASDPRKRLEVARKIIGTKLQTLGLHPTDARAFRAEIIRARTILDLMAAEARAGLVYYYRWHGVEMRFYSGLKNRDDTVPDHWKVFVTRAAPPLKGLIGTSLARNAAMPIGAMLNYSFAVALGQCTRAVIGAGLDPSIGLLHVPRQGRLSFAYDVLELHRAALTSAVFAHVGRTTFARGDFEQSPVGVVSLGAAVARDIAAISLRTVTMTACGKTVHTITRWM